MAGVALSLNFLDADLRRSVSGRFAGFEGPGGLEGDGAAEPLRLSVEMTESAGDASLRDLSVRCDGGVVHAARSDLDGEFDTEAGCGALRIYPTDYPDVSLEAFLRFAVSVWALKHGGMLVHGAGVVTGGRGYAFIGKSGAGKSTLSKLALSRGLTLLTDEIALLRRVNGRWWIAGTPFSGEVTEAASPGPAPLAAVTLIRKSADMKVGRPRRGSEMRQLMRNILMFGAPAPLMSNLLHSALLLLSEVGLKTMHFRPEPGVWELIDDLS